MAACIVCVLCTDVCCFACISCLWYVSLALARRPVPYGPLDGHKNGMRNDDFMTGYGYSRTRTLAKCLVTREMATRPNVAASAK